MHKTTEEKNVQKTSTVSFCGLNIKIRRRGWTAAQSWMTDCLLPVCFTTLAAVTATTKLLKLFKTQEERT